SRRSDVRAVRSVRTSARCLCVSPRSGNTGRYARTARAAATASVLSQGSLSAWSGSLYPMKYNMPAASSDPPELRICVWSGRRQVKHESERRQSDARQCDAGPAPARGDRAAHRSKSAADEYARHQDGVETAVRTGLERIDARLVRDQHGAVADVDQG